MIPILFEKSETTFTTNGLGRLADAISCLVTEERNGIYELEMEYPVSGVHFDEITVGRILVTTHDENADLQPFDIYEKSEPIDGVVTFYAHHISYRLNEIVVAPFTASTCSAAIAGLKSNSIGTNAFTFGTNKNVSASYEVKVPSTLRGLLGGEENSLLDVFGTGEYKFDNFSVYLYTARGTDTDVSIRYGKNLVEFENELDYSSTYNAVVPYWYGEEYDSGTGTSTGTLVTLSEQYITSNNTLPCGRTVMVPLDMSGDFEAQPTQANLRTAATTALSNSYGWLPSQNIKIDFVQLWQTDEYASYTPLQKVSLCDTVLVSVPMYGITDLRIKVIKVVWNALLDRYDEMELGTPSASFASVMSEDYSKRFDNTQNELNQLHELLAGQIDSKIETWTQSTNPATSWTTQDLKDQHNGDLWLYTGTSTITVGGVSIYPQGVYQYNSASNTWAAYSSTTNNLFDLLDGKTTIYYGTTAGSYPNVRTGDYLVDSVNGKTYTWNGSQWVLLLDYKTYTNTAVGNAKVAYVEVQYCLSSSNASFVQYGSWQTTMPTYVSGYYYWTRTVTYYGDGTNDGGSTPRFYQSGQTAVETQNALNSTNNHFWYDNTGAYVTEDDGTYSTGYATRITNQGILQTHDGNLMSSWTNSGINFYSSDGSGDPIAQFGSSAILGSLSGYHSELSDSGFKISSGADDILDINASGETRTETVTSVILAQNDTPTQLHPQRETTVAMAYGVTYTITVYASTTQSFTVSPNDASELPSSNSITSANGCKTDFSYSEINNDYYEMRVAQSLVGTLPIFSLDKVTRSYQRTFLVPVMEFAGDIKYGINKATITSFSSGWAVYDSAASSVVTVRKQSNVVCLTGAVTNTSAITLDATAQTIFTIPSGYRPSQGLVVLEQGSTTNVYCIRIATTGAVTFERYRNSTSYASLVTGSWFPFHITWIMD